MRAWLRLLLGSPEERLRFDVEALKTELQRATTKAVIAQTERDELLNRYVELLSQMVRMKREGFTAPEQPVSEARAPEPADDIVTDAMRSRAEPGTALWNELARYRRMLERQELAPEEIAGHILQGAAEDIPAAETDL